MVERVLGAEIQADTSLAPELWSALANVRWHHADHGEVGYSFRAAGQFVAWVWEDGDCLDWYCSGEPGVVSARIGEVLVREGWIWNTLSSG